MTDQEQMDWYNGVPYAGNALFVQHNVGGPHVYATLEEFRAARRASHQEALASGDPMHRLEAALIPEEFWWDPTCAS